MSVIRCEYHNLLWDSDMVEQCHRCEAEEQREKADAYNEWVENARKKAKEETEEVDRRDEAYWEARR